MMTAAAIPENATIGIVGAGTMGAGIAQIALRAGHRVHLVDADAAALARARATIAGHLDRMVEKGRLDARDRDDTMDRLRPASGPAGIADCRLVVEAIVEDLSAKRQLFAGMEEHVADDAILASNTSSISITAIARALARPERCVGMHFFNPAPLMRLVEVVSGLATSSQVAETVAATARAWGKDPVMARSTPGFIVNRVARPYYGEAFRLLEEGAADAATIDAILRDCGGFRMGPFELADLIGHDVNHAVTRTVFDAFSGDPRYRPALFQQELVAAGRLGRKTGRGIYTYGNDVPSPPVSEEPPCPAPSSIRVEGGIGPLHAIVDAAKAAGVTVETTAEGPGMILVEGAAFGLSDGRLAIEHSLDGGYPVALVDWCLDWNISPRVAVAFCASMDEPRRRAIIGLLQAAGRKVTTVADLPGLVVARTVAMLANEAAEAVHLRVAGEAGIDTAMKLGVNYPRGPLEWARAIGFGHVAGVMTNLRRLYGEDRYRPSLRLQYWNLASRHQQHRSRVQPLVPDRS
ncbi:MAG: 3-hydroxyacyl-CoA dehydrogenase [Geminicoccaceae bacterium]